MANKYEQLADILREKIRLGTYQEGDAIPSEATLQEEFHYSRHTVRQAIAVLVNEGYLRKNGAQALTFQNLRLSIIKPQNDWDHHDLFV